jgi:hypothetical protein
VTTTFDAASGPAFAAVIVYVIVVPCGALVAGVVFVIERSADWLFHAVDT